MERIVYRVCTDTVEFSANSHNGSQLVGKPFPRDFSEDEIKDIYFSSGTLDETKVADYETEAEAIKAAKKISISTEYHHYAIGYIRSDIVTIEEVKITTDEDGDEEEEWTGLCLFRAEPYIE